MAANPLPFLIKLAEDHHQALQPNLTHVQPGSTEPESENTKRGKNPRSRGITRKKTPQRGMGVAQLERLRLQQERRKTTLEADQLQSFTIQPFLDPVSGVPVPVQCGTWSTGAPTINDGGLLSLDLCGQRPIKRVDNGGYYYKGFNGVTGSGQVLVHPYGVLAAPDMRRVRVGTPVNSAAVFETSRELSSMPNIRNPPSVCDVCLKKKRFYGEDVGNNENKVTYVDKVCKGRRDKYAETSPLNVNGVHLLGHNQPNNTDSNLELDGFNSRDAVSAFYDFDEGMEVMAIDSKDGSVDGSVLTEYEFFPGKNGKSTSFKEMEFPAEASVAVAGEASRATTSADNGYRASNASSSVDLSLKLSC